MRRDPGYHKSDLELSLTEPQSSQREAQFWVKTGCCYNRRRFSPLSSQRTLREAQSEGETEYDTFPSHDFIHWEKDFLEISRLSLAERDGNTFQSRALRLKQLR